MQLGDQEVLSVLSTIGESERSWQEVANLTRGGCLAIKEFYGEGFVKGSKQARSTERESMIDEAFTGSAIDQDVDCAHDDLW